MKYSEYLRRVKELLATPDSVQNNPDRQRLATPICYANADASTQLRTEAQFAEDDAAAQQVLAHAHRLKCAIKEVLQGINRQLPENQYYCTYPAAVMALAMHRSDPNPPTLSREWGQKLRHELMNKLITEAELEERNHG